MLAETMVASLRKQNKGCFTCGDKCLQKSAPTAIEKCIEPKIVNLNLTLKGNLFRETPSRGPPPMSPSTKTWGEFHLFPQTLNIQQCCHRYTSPKWLSFLPSSSPLYNLLDFLSPCPHKPSVFFLADLVWLNRQEGQGYPNGENRLHVSDIFLSLKRQEKTN